MGAVGGGMHKGAFIRSVGGVGVIRRVGPRSFCTTAPLLSGECGASTKMKGFGDARIITVLQAITLPINHRGPFLLSSPGRRRGNVRLSLTSGPQCPATKSEGETFISFEFSPVVLLLVRRLLDVVCFNAVFFHFIIHSLQFAN